MSDMKTPRYLPPVPGADDSDSDLGARLELQRALRDLAKAVQSGQISLQEGQAALTQHLEQLDRRFQARLDSQDQALLAIQAGDKARLHANELEALRRSFKDQDTAKRLDSHSELVKALPGIRQSVDELEKVLQSARKARSAILLTLLEKAGGWLMAGIATLAALHFAGTPNAAPSPPAKAPTVLAPPGP